MGSLDEMQAELLSANPLSRVRIVAVNAAGTESALEVAVEGRSVPVVQDTPEAAAWAAWNAIMDDLVVLDGDGRALGLINLKVHDLTVGREYGDLLDYLRLAAEE